MAKNNAKRTNTRTNKRGVPNTRNDNLLTRFGDASVFQIPEFADLKATPKRKHRTIITTLASQLSFDGAPVSSEVDVALDSDIWLKLPSKRKAS